MPYNIGAFVSVSGETEFTAAMKNMKAQMGYAKSEAAALTSKYQQNDKSAEALRARAEALTKAEKLQKDALKLAQDALQRMKDSGVDPASTGFLKMKQNVDNATATLNRTENELEQLRTDLEHVGEEAEKTGTGFQTMGTYSTGAVGQIISGGRDAAAAFQAGDWGGLIQSASAVVGGISAIGTAALEAAKKIADLAKEVSGHADEIITESSKYNLDTTTYQQLEYASNFVDVSVSTMGDSMLKLQKKMAAASDSFITFGSEGHEASVQIRDGNGNYLETIDVYYQLIDALGSMTDQVSQDAAAQEIFGKSFKEIKPLIDAGSDALKGYMDHAQESGYIMDTDQIAKLGAMNDAFDELQVKIQTARNEFILTLYPAIMDVVGAISKLVDGLVKIIDYFDKIDGRHITSSVYVDYQSRGGSSGTSNGWWSDDGEFHELGLDGYAP